MRWRQCIVCRLFLRFSRSDPLRVNPPSPPSWRPLRAIHLSRPIEGSAKVASETQTHDRSQGGQAEARSVRAAFKKALSNPIPTGSLPPSPHYQLSCRDAFFIGRRVCRHDTLVVTTVRRASGSVMWNSTSRLAVVERANIPFCLWSTKFGESYTLQCILIATSERSGSG